MKSGPDIARTAALIGDPARANILIALMSGKALTVTELAQEAGISVPTASGHLSKLQDGGMVRPRKEGRHKYFALAGEAAASVLESLLGFAAGQGQLRTRTGPRDDAMRKARVCYNHLAGEAGIRIFESLQSRNFLAVGQDGLTLTGPGRDYIAKLGVDLEPLEVSRTPLCRECLDWSERKSHLAGGLGRALLDLFQKRGMVRRESGSRVIRFAGSGEMTFNRLFPVDNVTPR